MPAGPGVAENNPIRLATPVAELPGVGVRRAQALARLDIHQVSHLLRHYPMRYEQEAAESSIKRLEIGGIGSTRGTIERCRWVPMQGRGRKGRFEATLRDDTGTLALTWFNAAYLRDKLHPGATVRVQGKVAVFNDYPQMANPKWEPLPDLDDAAEQGRRLRPVYPATEDLPSPHIEKLIAQVLPRVADQLVDPLPPALLAHHAMPALPDAFRMVHAPAEADEHKAARRRLACLCFSASCMRRGVGDSAYSGSRPSLNSVRRPTSLLRALFSSSSQAFWSTRCGS